MKSEFGMLREEAPPVYIYMCIKEDKSRNNIFSLNYYPRERDVIYSEKDIENNDNYVRIGTYRRAFIGDMQEKYDKAMGWSGMKYYAECGCPITNVTKIERVEVEKVVIRYFPWYIIRNIIDGIRHRIELRKKRNQQMEDNEFFDSLFGYGFKNL